MALSKETNHWVSSSTEALTSADFPEQWASFHAQMMHDGPSGCLALAKFPFQIPRFKELGNGKLLYRAVNAMKGKLGI